MKLKKTKSEDTILMKKSFHNIVLINKEKPGEIKTKTIKQRIVLSNDKTVSIDIYDLKPSVCD